ncbi:MAG: hypothetical protein K6U80_20520 [Firmicutes bacterium]|nr:hypothetical protein [Bacillota bacterium]
MRRAILLLVIAIIFVSGCTVFGKNQFPTNEIKDIKAVELSPTDSMAFNDYVQKDLKVLNEYHEWWSTLHPLKTLSKFSLTTMASSTLNNSGSYKSANLCDGKAETAWVPGIKGGIGEWVKINIEAYAALSEYTSTPFSLFEIGVLPGYAKSSKTWSENNRVKKLLVVAHSPKLAENEWVVYRLNLKDEARLQVFKIPNDKIGFSINQMKKEIWLKIEDVYKGTKYDDTCISEFVAVGGFSN